MIKAIIIDCFGVLTDDTWLDYVRSLPKSVHEAIHELNHQRSSGTLTRSEFVDRLTEVIGRSRDEIDQASSPGGQKNILLLEYLEQLKKQNYKIGLLSNVGSDWVKSKFLTLEEKALFDDILLSYEVSMRKPSSEVYHLAAKRLGVEINQCVLIDDIGLYCEAAQQQGMQAVHYDNFEQMKRDLEELLHSKT